MLKRILCSLAVSLIVFSCLAVSFSPVRGSALGGAYSTSIQDASAMTWNPAAGWSRGWGYAVEYNRLYMGFDDNLYRGQISGYRDFGGYGFGLSLATFGADMYSRTEIGLAGKKALGPFSVGVRPKFLFDGFNSSNFHYNEGDDLDDPLYRDGTGASSFGLDAGAVFEVSERLSFGLSAQDIIAPSLGQEETIAEPTDLRFGSRYSIENIKTDLSGEFGFALNAPDGEELSFGMGVESYILSDWLGLRAGVSNSAFGAGIGIEIPQLAGLGLDITYSKPFGDLGKVANTLQFGIRGSIVPPEKESNLTVRCSATPDVIALDDSALVEIEVKNSGDDNCGAFTLDLKTNGELIRTWNLPGLDGGENTTIIAYYSSDKGGEVLFSIKADAPNAIAESDEDDNSCETGFRAVPPPEVEILATPSILRLRTISYTYQDEGVVPAVFFEQNKSKIDSRFAGVISLIARRVADNPNVFLEIMGYIGPDESNEELARSRADSESETSWGEMFEELKMRGLSGVQLIVSDQHSGLMNAIRRYFYGAVWQRCAVHYVRNFKNKLSPNQLSKFLAMLKKIWEEETVEDARRKASELIFALERVRPDVAEWIEETIDDTLAIYAFPARHRRKLKSTNMLERVNQELKRRTHVVRIFPNVRACLRMCGTLCMEYSEEWSTGKRYLTMENPTKTEIENEANMNLQKI